MTCWPPIIPLPTTWISTLKHAIAGREIANTSMHLSQRSKSQPCVHLHLGIVALLAFPRFIPLKQFPWKGESQCHGVGSTCFIRGWLWVLHNRVCPTSKDIVIRKIVNHPENRNLAWREENGKNFWEGIFLFICWRWIIKWMNFLSWIEINFRGLLQTCLHCTNEL